LRRGQAARPVRGAGPVLLRASKAALASQPRHLTAAFNLGTALEQLERPVEAIEAYRRAAVLRHLKAYKLLSEQA
jgi:hypothetical protein